jgi:molybdenum cofactor biosynthesis enzyme MoaA
MVMFALVHLQPAKMNSFMLVHVIINYKCNFNCKYCYAKKQNQHFEDMSLEDYRKLLSWFRKQNIKRFLLIGGEPTIHPNIKEFISLALKNKFEICLCTNALFEKEMFEIIKLSSNMKKLNII